MTIPDAAVDLVKRFEGLRLEAYRCPAGKWTIGYGSTIGVTKGQTITAEQAEQRLRDDLEWFARGVQRMVRVPITRGQFGALVSFAYNMGLKAFADSTLLKKLNAGDYAGARAEFPRWVHAGGLRLLGLVERRAAEQELWDA